MPDQAPATTEPTASTALTGWRTLVPGLTAVRTYQRSWLRFDVVAGVVLAAILVPQGMAYAELAGLPPVTGLYTTIACLVGYALMGPVAGARARTRLVGVAADLRSDRAARRRR